MKRRMTVLLLTLMLICALLPAVILSASAETYSGTCGAEGDGSNLTWTLDGEVGELIISGCGEMRDYTNTTANPNPWHWPRIDAEIKTLRVENGATSVGSYAFYLTDFTEANLSATVKSIGKGAFSKCDELSEVIIRNPDCEIYDSKYTFSQTATLYGYQGSTAEEYAYKYDFPFVALEPLQETCEEHSFSYYISQRPDEENSGVLTGLCERCGATTELAIPSISSADYDCVIVKAATCTEPGVSRYTWQNTSYGDIQFNVGIEATGHSYLCTEEQSATCTQREIFSYCCENCGHTYKTYGQARGHVWDAGTVTISPTCTENGEKQYQCLRCGETVSVAMQAEGHARTNGTVLNAASCTQAGLMQYECEKCGQLWQEQYFESHIYDLEAECCTICGVKQPIQTADNLYANNYETGGWLLGDEVFGDRDKTTLAKLSDDRLLLTLYDESRLVSEVYLCADGERWQIVSSHEIPMELPIYGGVYVGEDYIFVVFGQNNTDKSDDCEVLRVVKYDKEWNRIDAASLYGANTKTPFDCGSLQMYQLRDRLYIHTCHVMYSGHQANMSLTLQISDMSVFKAEYDMTYRGYVSHSLNQFIAGDGATVVTLDHGDGYPRSPYICLFDADKTYLKGYTFEDFDGESGENATGASLGGLVVTDRHILFAGNSVLQDGTVWPTAQRNIFVAVFDRVSAEYQYVWLTDYTNGEQEKITNPRMVQLEDSRVLVLWRDDRGLCYCFIEEDGTWDGRTYCSAEGDLSDCTPIVVNGAAVWSCSSFGSPIFFELNPSEPERIIIHTAEERYQTGSFGEGNAWTYDTATFTLMTSGTGAAWIPNKSSGVRRWVVGEGFTSAAGGQYNEYLEHVSLPNTITKIGERAFMKCTSLRSIIIPGSVKKIDHDAFNGCTKLRSVVLENGVKYIGMGAFSNCRLSEVVIPPSISQISNGAFNSWAIGSRALRRIYVQNPDAEIVGYNDSSNNGALGNPGTTVVYGFAGSTAEAFSEEMGYKFRVFPCAEDGHTYYTKEIQPSCEENGCTQHICFVCGDCYNTDEIDALGHEWDEGVVTIEPTVTTAGEKLFTCLRCGKTRTEETPALPHDHSYTPVITTPTCTEQGYTTYTCSICGDSYVGDYVDALGHDLAEDAAVPATCTETGLTVGEHCTRCDYKIPQEIIAALGHDFKDGKCTRCGAADPNYKPTEPTESTESTEPTSAPTEPTTAPTEPTTKPTEPTEPTRPPITPTHFNDVKTTAWYYDAVNYAVSMGLMNGVGNNNFAPDAPMTRAMLVTVLWRYEGSRNEGTNGFTDVPNGQWYTQAVAWAAANGIVGGVGNGKFDPNGNITREQMAAILFRYAERKGFQTYIFTFPYDFPDAYKISDWAFEPICWAIAAGIIGGSDGKLLPQGNATRAQVSTILMRFIENIAK